MDCMKKGEEEKWRWVKVFVHGSGSLPVSNSHVFSRFNIDEGAQSISVQHRPYAFFPLATAAQTLSNPHTKPN